MIIQTFQREKDQLEITGFRWAKRIAVKALVAAVKAYKTGRNPGQALQAELARVELLLADAMAASELMGTHRTLITAGKQLGKDKKGLGPYDWARDFVKKRLPISDDQMDRLKDKYRGTAANVTNRAVSGAVEAAQKAVQQIVTEGMHIKQGVSTLRRALISAGLNADQPWLLETLVRTQIHIAYGAGRWIANQDPDIQEILWGYEYVAIDDDRLRPAHAALNGTRLPKDDPRWREIWPPNGYNCRCEVIEVFEKVEAKEPPETVEGDDGRTIPVRPDKGFDMNPGQVFIDPLGGFGWKK
jgi:SPP1 gp7 family putative phage head morphogenesis protein